LFVVAWRRRRWPIWTGGELKAVATQIEAEKKGVEDARLKPLPDEGEELFRSPEGAVPKSQEYEILKMKLQLRKLEVEAEKEAHKADAEKEAANQKPRPVD